jgi:hypothetical protein
MPPSVYLVSTSCKKGCHQLAEKVFSDREDAYIFAFSQLALEIGKGNCSIVKEFLACTGKLDTCMCRIHILNRVALLDADESIPWCDKLKQLHKMTADLDLPRFRIQRMRVH